MKEIKKLKEKTKEIKDIIRGFFGENFLIKTEEEYFFIKDKEKLIHFNFKEESPFKVSDEKNFENCLKVVFTKSYVEEYDLEEFPYLNANPLIDLKIHISRLVDYSEIKKLIEFEELFDETKKDLLNLYLIEQYKQSIYEESKKDVIYFTYTINLPSIIISDTELSNGSFYMLDYIRYVSYEYSFFVVDIF